MGAALFYDAFGSTLSFTTLVIMLIVIPASDTGMRKQYNNSQIY